MLKRSEVLTRMEGINLKLLARNAGLNYSGVYNLFTRRTASYDVIEALSDYFETREKAIADLRSQGVTK